MRSRFTIRLILAALLAAVLVLASSCEPPAPGDLAVEVVASGLDAHGKAGDLQISVREGTEGGIERQFHVQEGYTLDEKVPFSWTFEDLEAKVYAVVVFHDLDDNGMDIGDVIASAGASTITVVSNTTEQVSVILDDLAE